MFQSGAIVMDEDKTLPQQLVVATSKTPGVGLSVFAREDLPCCFRFGPFNCNFLMHVVGIWFCIHNTRCLHWITDQNIFSDIMYHTITCFHVYSQLHKILFTSFKISDSGDGTQSARNSPGLNANIAGSSNWICYLSSSHIAEDVNLVAFEYSNNIYYLTIKPIKAWVLNRMFLLFDMLEI